MTFHETPPVMAFLARHPESRAAAVRSLKARVDRAPDSTLAVAYMLEANLDDLRLPAPAVPRIADRLWEHTCF